MLPHRNCRETALLSERWQAACFVSKAAYSPSHIVSAPQGIVRGSCGLRSSLCHRCDTFTDTECTRGQLWRVALSSMTSLVHILQRTRQRELRALSSKVQGVQRARTSPVQMDSVPETQALAKQPQRLTKLPKKERHTTGLIMASCLYCLHAAGAWLGTYLADCCALNRSRLGHRPVQITENAVLIFPSACLQATPGSSKGWENRGCNSSADKHGRGRAAAWASCLSWPDMCALQGR